MTVFLNDRDIKNFSQRYGPNETMITDVTVMSKRYMNQLTREDRANEWLQVHLSARGRIAERIAAFWLMQHDSTFHEEPPFTELNWDDDPDAIAYILSVSALKHHDLSYRLIRGEKPDSADGIIHFKLRTLDGCESGTGVHVSPAPRFIQRDAGRSVRLYARRGVDEFDTWIYEEIDAR